MRKRTPGCATGPPVLEAPARATGAEHGSARGLSLILAGTALQTVLRLALVAITARFVSPAETGAFQLALSIVVLAMAAADPGFSEMMARKRAQSQASASTFFWANVGLAAAASALLALLSGPLTAPFGAPEARGLVIALAVLPVLAALSIAPFVELRRRLRFAEIAMIDSGACAAGCVACVITAANGGGAWALAAFQFSWFGARLLAGFARAPVLPAFVFKARALKRAAGFCAQIWAARLASALSTHLDKIVLGAILGAAALGLYSQGTNFVSVPVQLITAATVTALVPSFARLRNAPARVKEDFLQTSHLVGALTLPIYSGAAALADLLVAIVLGRGAGWDWSPVGPLLAVMALAGALESLMRPQRALLVATGRAGAALAVTFASACALLAGVAAGAALGGLHGAALGYSGASLAVFAPATALTLRHAGATAGEYMAAIGPPALSSAAMCAGLALVRPAMAASGASEAVQFAALILLGTAAYMGCLLMFGRNNLRQLSESLFPASRGGRS